MPDPAARDAAEEASAFSHPAVAPDASAAYGDHPDQVVDFYAPRDGRTRAPLVVALHGGAWRARKSTNGVRCCRSYGARHAPPCRATTSGARVRPSRGA